MHTCVRGEKVLGNYVILLLSLVLLLYQKFFVHVKICVVPCDKRNFVDTRKKLLTKPERATRNVTCYQNREGMIGKPRSQSVPDWNEHISVYRPSLNYTLIAMNDNKDNKYQDGNVLKLLFRDIAHVLKRPSSRLEDRQERQNSNVQRLMLF
jgi:hypothetical protein